MRDLLFKNLTSADKKRKIISSSEIVDRQGVRSIIRRHFVCIVKEVKKPDTAELHPQLFVIKQRNTKEHTERFFCKIKGTLCAVNKGTLYSIYYLHSLNVNLCSAHEGQLK